MSFGFSKGDKVRVIDVKGQDPGRGLVLSLGEIHTIEEVTRHGWPRFGGYDWLPERFEKVEPEWVVGQQIGAADYPRLPVGARVNLLGPEGWLEKVDKGQWVDDHGNYYETHAVASPLPRTLTHLGDGTHAEPGDADDVEPEPLKAGEAVLVWATVVRESDLGNVSVRPGGDTEFSTWVDPDAIVRPDAGQVPPWVNVATANVAAIARVLMDEGGMEHAAAFAHAESLDRAGIRAEGGVS